MNPRGELFIAESDVYRLTMRSNMTYAEEFQDWVSEEVIPSLRKTGRYQIGGAGKVLFDRQAGILLVFPVE